jgi:hypothetical protein
MLDPWTNDPDRTTRREAPPLTYAPDSRIAHALRLAEERYSGDRAAQARSLRAELHYSAFLTPEDRRAFRAEIDGREGTVVLSATEIDENGDLR